MFQPARIAIRNIARQKRRSALLGGSVAFGFLIITLVNGYSAGIVKIAKDNFASMFGGHLYITGAEVSGFGSELSIIRDDGIAMKAIESLGDRVVSTHRRSTATGTLYFGAKESSQKIEGIDFADEREFLENAEIRRGTLDNVAMEGALVLPDDDARKLGAEIGDTIIYKTTTVSGQQNVADFVLIATTVSNGIIPMQSGFVGKNTLNRIVGIDGTSFQKLNVYLRDISDAKAVCVELCGQIGRSASVEPLGEDDLEGSMAKMQKMLGLGGLTAVTAANRWSGTKYSFMTIEDLMQPVMSLVAILDVIAFSAFLAIVAIVMVGIVNSYRMIMIERTSEIGTMRAMGMQKKGIRDIFFLEALFVSAIGAITGFAVALLASIAISSADFSTVGFPSVFLTAGHFAFVRSIAGNLKNFAVICVMSLVAVCFPARKASNLEPAEALRVSY
jgi:putative ABC transport system permease protein